MREELGVEVKRSRFIGKNFYVAVLMRGRMYIDISLQTTKDDPSADPLKRFFGKTTLKI